MSFFEKKERLDGVLYKSFNILSDGMFYLKHHERNLLKSNKDFSQKHKNERCFILATGPSLSLLSDKDIQRLTTESIFGVNSFYKASQTSVISPDYYVLMDNNYWTLVPETYAEIAERYAEKLPTFITDIRAHKLVEPMPSKILLKSKHYPTEEIRTDLTGNISATLNVVSFAIMSALYMGYKEIYLLGCDYNLFCAQKDQHCYDDTSEYQTLPTYNLAFYLKYYHLTTEFHYLLDKTARQKDVKIINLTPGSLLDAYRYNTLENVL